MRDEYYGQWHAEHDPPLGHEPVTEDAVFGNHAAIACHMANESYFRKKTVYWDAASHSITS